MVASNGFAEFLRDQLAPLGRITPMRVCSARPACCDGFMLIFEGHAGTGPENRLG
jgi:hypothetical protein